MLVLSNANDSNANNAAIYYNELTTNFEKAGGGGDQKWFLELPRATPGS